MTIEHGEEVILSSLQEMLDRLTERERDILRSFVFGQHENIMGLVVDPSDAHNFDEYGHVMDELKAIQEEFKIDTKNTKELLKRILAN